MDTATAYRAFRRGWYYLTIGALMAAAVAVYLNQAAPRSYEASATYVISPAQTDAGGINDTVRTIEDARSRAVVGTYVEILASDAVAQDAAGSVGVDPETIDDYENLAPVAGGGDELAPVELSQRHWSHGTVMCRRNKAEVLSPAAAGL